jgi:hypothetical protein
MLTGIPEGFGSWRPSRIVHFEFAMAKSLYATPSHKQSEAKTIMPRIWEVISIAGISAHGTSLSSTER